MSYIVTQEIDRATLEKVIREHPELFGLSAGESVHDVSVWGTTEDNGNGYVVVTLARSVHRG